MPRTPGTKSTRKTYRVEQLVVSSFLMGHEEWLWRRPCAIIDCDHRMGPKADEVSWIQKWEEQKCSNQVPAAVVLDDGTYDTHVGYACPCHVEEILARD